MRREYVSLDAPTADGRALHELIADPRTFQDGGDDAAQDDAAVGEDDAHTPSRVLALVGAIADSQESRRRATAAEAEAARYRRQANADARQVIALANALVESIKAEQLGCLSPQQLAIVAAQIEIMDEGEKATHHEVARRLGLHPAAVSRQWARVLTKLARAKDQDVSTPAA